MAAERKKKPTRCRAARALFEPGVEVRAAPELGEALDARAEHAPLVELR